MSGESDLNALLASMSPRLDAKDYVFWSAENAQYGDHSDLEPVASCMEPEGLTLVITKAKADARALPYDAVFKRITLEVHSSLEAVGLTAAFATKLSEHGISANVVAGYFHDHIFVQSELADRAMAALGELS
ncbi:MAG: ACT domain-containing protein [Halioglobus sp.]